MTKTLLKNKEPNRLEVFNCRIAGSAPVHFEYIKIPLKYNLEESISKWIKEHLKGRYYVGKSLNINKENTIENVLKIGFEEPKELSYFTLACPLLKYK
jgi:hypothetical protein